MVAYLGRKAASADRPDRTPAACGVVQWGRLGTLQGICCANSPALFIYQEFDDYSIRLVRLFTARARYSLSFTHANQTSQS